MDAFSERHQLLILSSQWRFSPAPVVPTLELAGIPAACKWASFPIQNEGLIFHSETLQDCVELWERIKGGLVVLVGVSTHLFMFFL